MPMEEVIRFKFIPSIAGGHICSSDKPVLLSLPARLGGLGIPLFHVLSLKLEKAHINISTDLIKDPVNGFEQQSKPKEKIYIKMF